MVATSGPCPPDGRHSRTRLWISATGRCPSTGSRTASTWIRDDIRRNPRARRKSPIRAVTAGSSAEGLGDTRSVSRQPAGIASFRPNSPLRILATTLHLACRATYSRAGCSLPDAGRNPVANTELDRRITKLVGALAPAEWWRLASMFAVIVALHLIGWFTLVFLVAPAQFSFGGKAFGVGIGLTAYTLGLRHAFDADHIAAIDNTTRKLMNDGQRPLAVGFFFSLGHSTVVFGLALLLATGVRAIAGPVQDDSSTLHRYTGLIGTGVSGAFLYAIALLNVIALAGILRVFARLRRGEYSEAELEEQLDRRGLAN